MKRVYIGTAIKNVPYLISLRVKSKWLQNTLIYDIQMECDGYPTMKPTFHPTHNPTMEPTTHPTIEPTHHPTFSPTASPTHYPIYDTF